MTEPPGRRLTTAESSMVSAFLALPLLAALRPQLPGLRVAGRCPCGCPTAYFAAGIDGAGRIGAALIADAQVSNTDGEAVLLFAAAGVLTSLEYLWLGDTPPLGWPPASWLTAVRVR